MSEVKTGNLFRIFLIVSGWVAIIAIPLLLYNLLNDQPFIINRGNIRITGIDAIFSQVALIIFCLIIGSYAVWETVKEVCSKVRRKTE